MKTSIMDTKPASVVSKEMENKNTLINNKKKGKGCCLWLFIIFVAVPLIIAMISIIFIDKGYEEANTDVCREKISDRSMLFSTLLKTDYSLTENEEAELDKKLEQLVEQGKPTEVDFNMTLEEAEQKMNEELADKYKILKLLENNSVDKGDKLAEKITQAKSLFKKLKENYPEGYFFLAEHVLKTDIKKEAFMIFFSGDNMESANFSLHELSHGGIDYLCNLPGFAKKTCYWIENKAICIPTIPKLPEGKEVLSLIEKKTDFDIKYLEKANQNIHATLEEIVAYTKSVRINRAYRCIDAMGFQSGAQPKNLSRQLYIFSLQLINIKNNHPQIWKDLANSKEFAYISNRFIQIAERELELYKEKALDAEKTEIEENLTLFHSNSIYLDELLRESKTWEIKDTDLDEKELKKLGILLHYIN